MDKADVWADLIYALDVLKIPSRDIRKSLTDTANLDAQPEDEALHRLFLIAEATGAYSKAESRADVRNAHEAIERGLKAILLDSGLSVKQVKKHSHHLDKLLIAVQQHEPTAFNELERCFNSTIQYLESVIPLKHNTNIVDYFHKHGKARVFEVSRYESIEGRNTNDPWGMIPLVYYEIIRALLSLISDGSYKDIDSRIEEEARKAILAESKLDPAWDAREWMSQGPVRPRLEVVRNIEDNTVLRAAVRRCARNVRDNSVRNWAMILRRNYITARTKTRAMRRVGYNPL